jgi:hypothetical protein
MYKTHYIPSVVLLTAVAAAVTAVVVPAVVEDCKNILLDFLLSATQASIAVSKSVSHACIFEQRHIV